MMMLEAAKMKSQVFGVINYDSSVSVSWPRTVFDSCIWIIGMLCHSFSWGGDIHLDRFSNRYFMCRWVLTLYVKVGVDKIVCFDCDVRFSRSKHGTLTASICWCEACGVFKGAVRFLGHLMQAKLDLRRCVDVAGWCQLS